MGPNQRPQVPEVMVLVRQLYETELAGCCLPFVLEDGNPQDAFVLSAIERAKQQNHNLCLEIATKMLLMSKTQRTKLAIHHSKKAVWGADISRA